MPRRPRLHVPGGVYHVILRGNDRQTIFFDANDRYRWESLLEEGVSRYFHRIHAYCWMTNHVHMAIQCNDVPLSKFMGFVASQYARSTNRKNNRSGHLFERRYRAVLVQADSYLQELVRYIHQNPLRAEMVDDIAKYQWSSHLAYMHGNKPSWLTLNFVLSMFGSTAANARSAYAHFMQVACREDTRKCLREGVGDDNRLLGDDNFLEALGGKPRQLPMYGNLKDLALEICRKNEVSAAVLESASRDRRYARIRAEIGFVAIENGIATNAEVARFFNRSQSGLCRAINTIRKQQISEHRHPLIGEHRHPLIRRSAY